MCLKNFVAKCIGYIENHLEWSEPLNDALSTAYARIALQIVMRAKKCWVSSSTLNLHSLTHLMMVVSLRLRLWQEIELRVNFSDYGRMLGLLLR